MYIVINTIDHSEQRYPTVGDWFREHNPSLNLCLPTEFDRINVSDMQNEDYEFLVGLHELIEWYLCKKAGVTAAQVDEFDMIFEGDLEAQKIYTEPGDDPRAPYFLEHKFATHIEKQMAEQLGIDWETYDKAVEEL